MVKLNKLVLSFLFSILCALPVPAFSVSKSAAVVLTGSAPAAEDTSIPGTVLNSTPANALSGKEILAMLIPATTGDANENFISAIVTGIDTNDKTEPAPIKPGSDKLLKASRLELFVGTSLMSLGYTEFDINGTWYDEETGALPGLLLGSTLHWPNWYASLELNYYFGDVDYRGQTQSFKSSSLSGLPINSRSNANIFDTTAITGYQFSTVTLYGGLGYYFRRRNILPTTTDSGLQVAGMLEFYSWSYAMLGGNVPLFRTWTSHLSLDARVTRMLQADMEVNFLGYGGYDNARLNLGKDWGLRLALPWTFRSSGNGPAITIEPWYARWNLKRGNVVELTTKGAYTGSVVSEPQSETRNFGISVYFRFLM